MITVCVVGRLGRDPEVRTTRSGDSVVGVSVASTQKLGGEERTTWLRLTIWGKRGEAFAQYHSKGDLCAVTGSLSCRKWNKDGEERESWEVDVRDWTFAGGKRDRETGGGFSADEDVPFAPVEVM